MLFKIRCQIVTILAATWFGEQETPASSGEGHAGWFFGFLAGYRHAAATSSFGGLWAAAIEAGILRTGYPAQKAKPCCPSLIWGFPYIGGLKRDPNIL